MMRGDFGMHHHFARPAPRPPPPQVMSAGDQYGHKVNIVFAASGTLVPWGVTYVNCPEKYLMRYINTASHGADVVREDGHFRVVWDDD